MSRFSIIPAAVLGFCSFAGAEVREEGRKDEEAKPIQLAAPPADSSLPASGERFEFQLVPKQGTPYYRFRSIFLDIGRDQRDIWLSPFRFERSDSRWIVPIGLAASALVPTDEELSERISGVKFPSKEISALGGPTNFLTAGAMWGIGKWRREPKVQETGLLGLRATADAWITVKALKKITDRERPDKAGGKANFWGGGNSFPSGHSAETLAFATVVAKQYPDKLWVKLASYGLASAVSFSRVSGKRHYMSDVVVGGVIGHLIGRHVVNDWKKRREFMRSKAFQLADEPDPRR